MNIKKIYNHRFPLALAFLTIILLLTLTACGDTPTPEGTPAITPTQTPEGIPMPTPTQDPNLSSAEKLGVDDIVLENIECIEFSYTKEAYTLFRTSDPEMMEDILTHFKSVTLSPPTNPNGVGGSVRLSFQLKEAVNGRSSCVLSVQPSDMYHANGIYYEVTEGAKTYEEWEAIMAACEQIKP